MRFQKNVGKHILPCGVLSQTHTTVRDKVDSWSMNSSQSGNEYSISYNE